MRAAFMGRLARLSRQAVILGYFGVVAVFGVVVARFYQPDAGFSHLIAFGGKLQLTPVSEMKNLNYFYQATGYGYDGQFYVQIAMHPTLREPELRGAVDNLPYRARRILTGWTAYALGLGKPAWILQAFTFQNVLTWLALAAVMLRWFPPVNWSNLLRWGGVLFGVGVCQSLRLALVDAPSLLLIAIGVWCVECNRRWLATGVFALSGLARETNLLAGVALIRPAERNWRHFGQLCVQAVLVAAPLALWLVYIHVMIGPSLDAGSSNFSAPFVAFGGRCLQVVDTLIKSSGGDVAAKNGFLVMISLTTQLCFLAFRPRPGEVWWRVGASFGLLMLVLGTAVWEGYPGAASRVLLPMHLAFNVLVPRGRRWLAVLILGNISLLVAPDLLQSFPGHGYRLSGASELRTLADGSGRAKVVFDEHWYDAEHRTDRYWRWADGDASFTVINPQARPVIAAVSFYLDGVDQRRGSVAFGGREVWTGLIGAGVARITLAEIELQPGENVFDIKTDQPPKMVGIESQRAIVCSLRNLEVRLLRFAP